MSRHYRTALALALVCLTGGAMHAQIAAQATLADNQPVSLHGTIEVLHRGWVTYAVLHTGRTYSVRFDPQADAPQPVTLIQLVLDWQGAALAAHAGAEATVQGKVMINPYSGYYLNGVAIVADAVTFADGTVLHTGQAPRPPAVVHQYLATVVLDPAAALWVRSAVGVPSGRPLLPEGLDGCATNAVGDLLNCGCMPGFAARRAGIVRAPVTAGHVEKLPRVDDGLAQLDLPDDATHPLTVQVLCTREKAAH